MSEHNQSFWIVGKKCLEQPNSYPMLPMKVGWERIEKVREMNKTA
jgi:hypothetical protein